jgi:hypothetical protein
MSCSTCKEKSKIKEELYESSEFVSKGVIWFVIVWSGLALYGLYTLITKFI